MTISHIHQENGYGCFIAAAAMLTDRTYRDVCRVIHPGYQDGDFIQAIHTNHVTDTAVEKLAVLGCKVKRSRSRKFDLLKKQKKNALLIIRWPNDSMCHCVVFDGTTKKFHDPMNLMPGLDEYDLRDYQRDVESILLVESVQTTTTQNRMEIAA